MMLGLHGRPSGDLDAFLYFLAHELHKTVGEIEDMPRVEFLHWKAYFTVREAVQNMRPVGPA